MALRNVDDHPKLIALKTILRCGRGEAMGYLEALWHFTGRFAPQGDVGRYPDAQIEGWIEWAGGRGVLIEALTTVGWVDRHPSFRLLVHDWHIHADAATKLYLKRSGKSFAFFASEHVATVSGLPAAVAAAVAAAEKPLAPRKRSAGRIETPAPPSASPSAASAAAPSAETSASAMGPEPDRRPDPGQGQNEPEPAAAHSPRARRSESLSDSNHTEFRELLRKYWGQHNAITMPWDGSEARALQQFLAANRDLDRKTFSRLLEHRSASERNHAERPRAWIARLTDFADGPLDRYGRPLNQKLTDPFAPREAPKTQAELDADRDAMMESLAANLRSGNKYSPDLVRDIRLWQREQIGQGKHLRPGDLAALKAWEANRAERLETWKQRKSR